MEAGFIGRSHDAGLVVIPYTVNRAALLRELVAAGADGVFTDDPAAIRRARERVNGSASTPGSLTLGIDQGSGGTRAVLVDEPMVGLDPRGARLIKDVFRRMSSHGVAILMSTHTLEVAEEMCDRISIILGGRIIACGTGATGAIGGALAEARR